VANVLSNQGLFRGLLMKTLKIMNMHNAQKRSEVMASHISSVGKEKGKFSSLCSS